MLWNIIGRKRLAFSLYDTCMQNILSCPIDFVMSSTNFTFSAGGLNLKLL